MLLDYVFAEKKQQSVFSADKKYLELLLTSRESDMRESILFRQGKGFFCLPSAGHENMAAIAYCLRTQDYIFCHYRDRALMLARGVELENIALDYFAKENSSSAGRQLSSHFSNSEYNIVSCASPVASQCLPAVGTAWAMKLDNNQAITVCCVGEASIRQGEFYEAWCFAVQEELPVIFIVEDNGYGISTPTERMNPLNLGIFGTDRIVKVNGNHAEQVYSAMEGLGSSARRGEGPGILWVKFDRLMSHTSSDDQKSYRSKEDLELCQARDPITIIRNALYENGTLNAEDWEDLQEYVKQNVRTIYEDAEKADEPTLQALMADVKSPPSKSRKTIEYLTALDGKLSLAKTVNKTLEHLLSINKRVVLFGQDIEDAKGGVFGLTKGLSSQFPGRVINSPLAEATICGTAAGMAIAGYVPIFEIQFVDFIATGFNQIANQIATMHWRTAGHYKCPLILLAPCGGYIHGGGPWHTQTNESLFAHIPGLQVYMPSNAADAADLLVNSAYSDNPSLILLPKQLFFKEFNLSSVTSIHHDSANILKEGNDVTLLAWGNCVELALQASEDLLRENINAEVIDLKSIVPCDMQTITRSLEKTGRLVIIHEDNRTCSVGQSIISQIVSQRSSWDMLYAPPQLVCRDDVLVPFNPTLAKLVLPCVDQIVAAAKLTLG